jgi:uncharacterized membrane protein YkvA (DUF1232 family)
VSLIGYMLVGLAVALLVYAIAVLALIVAGRRGDARALARFIPDCIVLTRRLLSDPRVPRRRKLLLVLLVAYLAMPFDLVPDFIPVAGQLDDAILVALVLRAILRSGGEELLREHWPGPEQSRLLVERLTRSGRGWAGGRAGRGSGW